MPSCTLKDKAQSLQSPEPGPPRTFRGVYQSPLTADLSVSESADGADIARFITNRHISSVYLGVSDSWINTHLEVVKDIVPALRVELRSHIEVRLPQVVKVECVAHNTVHSKIRIRENWSR